MTAGWCNVYRVGYIVNVTEEIDNFFPGMFNYCNIRVTDDETTDLLKHWQKTYDFIDRARCVVFRSCFISTIVDGLLLFTTTTTTATAAAAAATTTLCLKKFGARTFCRIAFTKIEHYE